jgi:uncharacterized membrane protein YeiH
MFGLEWTVDPVWIAYMTGIVVAAASGALLAAERKFDVVGAIFLAIAVSVGGGTLVDLLLGVSPVRWLRDPTPLAVAAIVGGVAFFTAAYVNKITRALDWLDAASLPLFAAAGLEYGLQHIGDPLAAGMLAILGACGGGIIRDTLANRDPIVFSGELYVTAVAAGVAAYYVAALIAGPGPVPFLACMAVTFILRGVAMMFGLRLSPPPQL